jgi:hypothetical protein
VATCLGLWRLLPLRSSTKRQRALPLAEIAVHEEGKSLLSNDDSSLCDTLYTVGGVGELYQRRSALF